MNDLPDRQDEAARWFAKNRRGVMSLEERAAFDLWRLDRANAAALTELERVWAFLDAAEHHFRSGMPAVSSTHSKRFARLVALVCLVSLGLGALSYSGNGSFWTKLDWTDR